MTGMFLKDAMKLKKVPLLENYPLEDMLPEDESDCIITCCNLEKNTMTNIKEQRIGYGPRRLTDLARMSKILVIG